jgi:cellulose synthase/poly-beta-1,6-N-acetylglucosamine synthase-like glycosyltransferase
MSKVVRYIRYTVETLLVNALILSSLYQLIVYLVNRRFWRQPPLLEVEVPPSISVVVPLRGKGPDTLALLHLLAATGPTDHYEVILVLESKNDPAYPSAAEVERHYPAMVRVVISGPAENRIGKIHGLNAGYAVTGGELVAFIEPNVQASAELWNAALAVMTDPAVGAAFAPPLVHEPEHRLGSAVPTGGEMLPALYTNHARTAVLPFAALSGRMHSLSGGFMIVRRQVLDEMGGLLHLLDESAEDFGLGRAVREIGYRIAAIPVPARIVLEPETFNDATVDLLYRMAIHRAYQPAVYLASPFANPLTVGFLLGFITEREGRWWGRQTWWAFVWLRMAIAYELDRLRFGRGFTWLAYAQLFMLDTFISPVLWLRALFLRTLTMRGRAYHLAQGGKITPIK